MRVLLAAVTAAVSGKRWRLLQRQSPLAEGNEGAEGRCGKRDKKSGRRACGSPFRFLVGILSRDIDWKLVLAGCKGLVKSRVFVDEER